MQSQLTIQANNRATGHTIGLTDLVGVREGIEAACLMQQVDQGQARHDVIARHRGRVPQRLSPRQLPVLDPKVPQPVYPRHEVPRLDAMRRRE